MNLRHPDWQDILDALEGTAPRPADLLAHLDSCEECRELAGAARDLLAGFSLARGTRPPAPLVEAAVRAVLSEADPWAPARAFLRKGLQVVRATLAADSLAPAPGFRGASPAGAPRLLLFEAPHHAVTLALGGAANAGGLRGQLVPKDAAAIPPGGRAHLVAGGSHDDCALSEFGEFRFEATPRAALHLAIEVGDERLEIGPIRTVSDE